MSAKHAPPKYRHFRPKNLGVVRIDGRDHYLGRYDSPESWEKYYRLLAEHAAAGSVAPITARPHEGPADDGPSVAEVILAYYRHAEGYYRREDGTQTAEVENICLALRPLRDLYGSTPARTFGPKALKAIRRSMVDAGLGLRTINQRIARIVRAFRHAVENELIPADVHHALKSVSGLKRGRSAAKEPRTIRPVPDEHVEATLPHLPRQIRAMIALQRLTGMRSGEVTIMRPCDLETSAGDVWVYRPKSHKNSHREKDRPVYLGPRAIEVVKPWLRLGVEEYLFQPQDAMAEHRRKQRERRKTKVQPSQRDRRVKRPKKRAPRDHYDSRSYCHAVAKACGKAGVPHWHPHQLRHSVATSLRSQYGVDLARVICGHSTLDATAIYAEADHARAMEVIRRIG
jgi:integrase